jgi:molybdopterin-containing oxidoreductase family membrane subunit
MRTQAVVVGIASDEQPLVQAVARLSGSKFPAWDTFSPIPWEGLFEEGDSGGSPVRFYTLIGAILGAAAGLLLTIWTSLDWSLLTGGKPIVSLPAFLVIVFELTILLGGLFTAAGFLLHARLLWTFHELGYQERFSNDWFGIAITCQTEQIEEAQQILRSAGMEQILVESA